MTAFVQTSLRLLLTAAAIAAVTLVATWTFNDVQRRWALSYLGELHVNGTPPGDRQFCWPRPGMYGQMQSVPFSVITEATPVAEADTRRIGPVVLLPPPGWSLDGTTLHTWWTAPAALLAAGACVLGAPSVTARSLRRRADLSELGGRALPDACRAARRRAVVATFVATVFLAAVLGFLNRPPLSWLDNQPLFVTGLKENPPLALALSGLLGAGLGITRGFKVGRTALQAAKPLCRRCCYPLPGGTGAGAGAPATADPLSVRCPECGKQQPYAPTLPRAWPWILPAVTLAATVPLGVSVKTAGHIGDDIPTRWQRFRETALYADPVQESPLAQVHGNLWTFAVKQGSVAFVAYWPDGPRMKIAGAVPPALQSPRTGWREEDFPPGVQRLPAEAYAGEVREAGKRVTFGQVRDTVIGRGSPSPREWPTAGWPDWLTDARRGQRTFIYTVMSPSPPHVKEVDPARSDSADAERLLKRAEALLAVPAPSRP